MAVKKTVKKTESAVKPAETKTDLAKKPEAKPNKIQTVSVDDSEFSCFLDTAKFNQLYRASELFAASQLVPLHYQGKPQNCFIAMQMAMRLKVDPMMFMQNTYIIQGKPGMEAKLVIALINSNGPFTGPVQWKLKGEGDSRECTAYAKHKATGEVCEATVTWKMATAEGWTGKAGSKWKTIPEQMFKYRSAVFLSRLYCPECTMGMSTVDELADIKANDEVIGGVGKAGVAGLVERLGTKAVESKEVTDAEPEVAPEPSAEEIEADNKLADEQLEDMLPEEEPVLGKQDKAEEPTALRYLCKECSHESGKLDAKGHCESCFSNKIIDRRTS